MKRRIYRATSALLGALASTAALASGFQLQEQSASGLGLAYSGMAAAAQDGSTVFWNPAGMSQLGGSGLAVAAAYIIPSFKFADAGSAFAALGSGGDGGVASLVPAVYAYTTMTPQLTLGLAVNAPFGLSTDWDSQWAGMFYGIKSKVETVNINPALSWKVNEILALGGGLSYQRLRATLTQGVTPLNPTVQGRIDGDDWRWGWNLGALLDFGQGTTLGATYRAAISYTITGKLGFNNAALAAQASDVKAGLRLPQTFSFGLSQKLTPQLRLLADYTRTDWDTISALTITATSGPAAGFPVSNTLLNFRNSWRAGAGLEYRIDPQWLLRAGAAYDSTPVQDTYRNPRLPDNDRTWLAVGARFEPYSGCAIDVGYAHLWVKNGPSELATAAPPFPDSLNGTYRASVNLLGLQASFKF